MLSLGNLITEMLKDKEPVVDRDLGCAYGAGSKLIVAKTSIASHQHADVDEFIYVIGGEGTLTVGDKVMPLILGGFALAPRGVSHAVTKKGAKEVVLYIVQSGKPCMAE